MTGKNKKQSVTLSESQLKEMVANIVKEMIDAEEKADQMKQLCLQYGWIPVSMKNDWKTIYGEGVTRKIFTVEENIR